MWRSHKSCKLNLPSLSNSSYILLVTSPTASFKTVQFLIYEKKINKKKWKITWYVEPVPKVIIPDSKSVIEIQFGPSSHVLTSIGRPRIVFQSLI
jgi:hypothetical protein